MPTIRKLAGSLALLSGLLLAGAPALAEVCQAEIDQELQRYSLSKDDVESLKIERRSFGAKSSSNFRYEAWVKPRSCETGHLVITLTKYCMVMDSYTRGGCSLPGAGSN